MNRAARLHRPGVVDAVHPDPSRWDHVQIGQGMGVPDRCFPVKDLREARDPRDRVTVPDVRLVRQRRHQPGDVRLLDGENSRLPSARGRVREDVALVAGRQTPVCLLLWTLTDRVELIGDASRPGLDLRPVAEVAGR